MSTSTLFTTSFDSTSPVAGIYRLWSRAYGLSVAANFFVAASLIFVTFLDMRGSMVIVGWASLAALGMCLAVIVFSMYLMGVVTDDFAIIKAFRSEVLTYLLAPVAVFVLGCLSLLLLR